MPRLPRSLALTTTTTRALAARLAPIALAWSVVGFAGDAQAQDPQSPPAARAEGPRVATQGVAVIGLEGARDDAYVLARAVYASSVRPRGLDELRARVLAGEPPPSGATRDVRELAELRAGVHGDDAASRRLLASIASQLAVQGILVVEAGRPLSGGAASTDAGAPVAENGAGSADAGEVASSANAAPTAAGPTARLYLTDSGDLDAARYAPDPGFQGAAAWRSTVQSLVRRFPSGPSPVVTPTSPVPPPTMRPTEESKGAFYTSPWFWGAIGGAVLLGGAFYFATRDTSGDTIHLEMKVPR